MKSKHLLLFLFLILFSINAFAQQIIRPWKGIRPVSRVRMWHYQAGKDNSGVSIIILPGGSYRHLGIRQEGHAVARFLSQNGYNSFVLRYSTRMYGHSYPVMMEDIQRAVMWIQEHAEEYGVDPHKIGVLGFSAGGHLAGWMGTYFDDNHLLKYGLVPSMSLKPAFVGMIYPVISMVDGIVHKKSRNNLLPSDLPLALRQYMSLEKNVRDDMPPVFLMACQDDPVVNPENSYRYNEALLEKGIPHTFHVFEAGGHGFGYEPNGKNKTAANWMADFLQWMKNNDFN